MKQSPLRNYVVLFVVLAHVGLVASWSFKHHPDLITPHLPIHVNVIDSSNNRPFPTRPPLAFEKTSTLSTSLPVLEAPAKEELPPSPPKVTPPPSPPQEEEKTPEPTPEKKPAKPTLKPSPSKPKPKAKTPSKPKKTAPESPKETPKKSVPKKSEAKKIPPNDSKKATAAKPKPPKPIAKKDPPIDPRQQQLLSAAKESLAKIGKNTDKVPRDDAVSVPQKIGTLQIDTPSKNSSSENDSSSTADSGKSEYQTELTSRIKLLLKSLPEYGKVKVRLILQRDGSISKVIVLSSESNKNREYITDALFGMNFPGFGLNFKGEEQHSFVFDFNNDYITQVN